MNRLYLDRASISLRNCFSTLTASLFSRLTAISFREGKIPRYTYNNKTHVHLEYTSVKCWNSIFQHHKVMPFWNTLYYCNKQNKLTNTQNCRTEILSNLSILDMLYISKLCWATQNVTDTAVPGFKGAGTLSYLGQFLVTTQTFYQVYHNIWEFIYFICSLL